MEKKYRFSKFQLCIYTNMYIQIYELAIRIFTSYIFTYKHKKHTLNHTQINIKHAKSTHFAKISQYQVLIEETLDI